MTRRNRKRKSSGATATGDEDGMKEGKKKGSSRQKHNKRALGWQLARVCFCVGAWPAPQAAGGSASR